MNMKQVLIALYIFSGSIIFGTALILVFYYATFEREGDNWDLSTQNIHVVRCMEDNGDLETYHIHIPMEVKDLDAYSEGFCKSLEK